jgi:hypothetical protein
MNDTMVVPGKVVGVTAYKRGILRVIAKAREMGMLSREKIAANPKTMKSV